MPPTVGHVAVNARYLHRQDVDEGSIAAAVTMSQVALGEAGLACPLLLGLLGLLGLRTGGPLGRLRLSRTTSPADSALSRTRLPAVVTGQRSALRRSALRAARRDTAVTVESA